MAATQGPKTGTYIIDKPIVLAYAATTGPAMSAALRAVFRELARYADPMIGIARPTLGHLAEVVDLSRQTVAMDLRDLECLGLITIRQAEGFSGKRNKYHFPAAATGWRATPKDPTRPRITLAAFRARIVELQREAQDRNQRIWEMEGSLDKFTGDDAKPAGNGSDTSAPRDGSPEVAPAPDGSGGPDRDSVGDQEIPNVKAHVNIRVEQDGRPPMAKDAGDCREAAASGEHVDGAADNDKRAVEESGGFGATPFIYELAIGQALTASYEHRRDPDVGDGGGQDLGLDSGVPVPGVEQQQQPNVPGDASGTHDPDAQGDTARSTDETG